MTKLIQKEEDDYPEWMRNENKITKNCSTAGEIRSHLRHIVLPHSLHSYQQLRSDLFKNDKIISINCYKSDSISENEIMKKINSDKKVLKAENFVSTDFSMIASLSSVTTSDSSNLNKVRNFFDKIKSGSEEGKVLFFIYFIFIDFFISYCLTLFHFILYI